MLYPEPVVPSTKRAPFITYFQIIPIGSTVWIKIVDVMVTLVPIGPGVHTLNNPDPIHGNDISINIPGLCFHWTDQKWGCTRTVYLLICHFYASWNFKALPYYRSHRHCGVHSDLRFHWLNWCVREDNPKCCPWSSTDVECCVVKIIRKFDASEREWLRHEENP